MGGRYRWLSLLHKFCTFFPLSVDIHTSIRSLRDCIIDIHICIQKKEEKNRQKKDRTIQYVHVVTRILIERQSSYCPSVLYRTRRLIENVKR